MRDKLTLPEVKSILGQVVTPNIGLNEMQKEMLPGELVNLINAAPDIVIAIGDLERQIAKMQADFTELNLAIAEYANATGEGHILLQNLKICLEQVRSRKQQ